MIEISEKTAKALLDAAFNSTKKNKTLDEAISLVTQRLNEEQIKPYAQIENLREIQDLAKESVRQSTREVPGYQETAVENMEKILRTVNRAISGRPCEPSQSADHRCKTPAQAGKAKGQPC